MPWGVLGRRGLDARLTRGGGLRPSAVPQVAVGSLVGREGQQVRLEEVSDSFSCAIQIVILRLESEELELTTSMPALGEHPLLGSELMAARRL